MNSKEGVGVSLCKVNVPSGEVQGKGVKNVHTEKCGGKEGWGSRSLSSSPSPLHHSPSAAIEPWCLPARAFQPLRTLPSRSPLSLAGEHPVTHFVGFAGAHGAGDDAR